MDVHKFTYVVSMSIPALKELKNIIAVIRNIHVGIHMTPSCILTAEVVVSIPVWKLLLKCAVGIKLSLLLSKIVVSILVWKLLPLLMQRSAPQEYKINGV